MTVLDVVAVIADYRRCIQWRIRKNLTMFHQLVMSWANPWKWFILEKQDYLMT